jgi:hypothetical protein
MSLHVVVVLNEKVVASARQGGSTSNVQKQHFVDYNPCSKPVLVCAETTTNGNIPFALKFICPV